MDTHLGVDLNEREMMEFIHTHLAVSIPYKMRKPSTKVWLLKLKVAVKGVNWTFDHSFAEFYKFYIKLHKARLTNAELEEEKTVKRNFKLKNALGFFQISDEEKDRI